MCFQLTRTETVKFKGVSFNRLTGLIDFIVFLLVNQKVEARLKKLRRLGFHRLDHRMNIKNSKGHISERKTHLLRLLSM
jgi:hypothetical protein